VVWLLHIYAATYIANGRLVQLFAEAEEAI
jgi:hypothetical protein